MILVKAAGVEVKFEDGKATSEDKDLAKVANTYYDPDGYGPGIPDKDAPAAFAFSKTWGGTVGEQTQDGSDWTDGEVY